MEENSVSIHIEADSCGWGQFIEWIWGASHSHLFWYQNRKMTTISRIRRSLSFLKLCFLPLLHLNRRCSSSWWCSVYITLLKSMFTLQLGRPLMLTAWGDMIDPVKSHLSPRNLRFSFFSVPFLFLSSTLLVISCHI